MRWRTWTFWLAVFVLAYFATRPIFLFFSTSAETWGVSELVFNTVMALPYVAGLLAPNQIGFAIDGLEWHFSLFPIDNYIPIHAAIYLIFALPFAVIAGRKLDKIQHEKGLLISIAMYAAISLALDAIVIGGIWYFIF